jgi:homoserine kinase
VTFRVRVPATSANLGPGFDCFGLALDLCNEFVVEPGGSGVTWAGEGVGELPTDGTDAVSTAAATVAIESGLGLPPFSLHGLNGIPLTRGLGSSAAATVAGVAIADRLLGLSLPASDVVRFASALEGHPDNVAAATLGGFTLAYDGGIVRLEPSPELRPVLLVPDELRLATTEAREALPAAITLADAVFTIGRAAIAVVALTADPAMLPEALKDRVHQPYRLPLVPAANELFRRLRETGVAVCVSGAGPSLLAFELPGAPVPDAPPGWRALRADVRALGVEILEPV